MIHPVILSGGSGTRLWPMSRTLYPKQLLSLLGRDSLLQQTVRRVAEGERVGGAKRSPSATRRTVCCRRLSRPSKLRSCFG